MSDNEKTIFSVLQKIFANLLCGFPFEGINDRSEIDIPRDRLHSNAGCHVRRITTRIFAYRHVQRLMSTRDHDPFTFYKDCVWHFACERSLLSLRILHSPTRKHNSCNRIFCYPARILRVRDTVDI